MDIEAVNAGSIVVETRIRGSAEKVWRALTSDIHRWWPESFYTGGTAGRRRYVLEARVGGRMYEEWEEGAGLLWATVNTVMPERRLDVFGVAFPEWGGPNLWTGTWLLKPGRGHTVVRFTEGAFGRISKKSLADKDKGWTFLFDGALRAHVEGRPAPAWEGPAGAV
jgi:uncharacterized protein YndB with AHSA1/START domain